jgi:predicted CXXCH cytochrome family protein
MSIMLLNDRGMPPPRGPLALRDTGMHRKLKGNALLDAGQRLRSEPDVQPWSRLSCHDPHGTANQAMLRKPINEICLRCHGPNTQNGPHAASIEAHTHHPANSAGSQCIACHIPKIEQTIANVNVASHTFHFVSPAATESLKIPNACNVCHNDKSAAWAAETMKSWTDRSPWRMSK